MKVLCFIVFPFVSLCVCVIFIHCKKSFFRFYYDDSCVSFTLTLRGNVWKVDTYWWFKSFPDFHFNVETSRSEVRLDVVCDPVVETHLPGREKGYFQTFLMQCVCFILVYSVDSGIKERHRPPTNQRKFFEPIPIVKLHLLRRNDVTKHPCDHTVFLYRSPLPPRAFKTSTQRVVT